MNAPSPARAPLVHAAPPVLRADAGEIAVVSLNRPEARNSLSEAMLTALGETFTIIHAGVEVGGKEHGHHTGRGPLH